MGRWLNELKKLENAPEANRQNPQNPLNEGAGREKTHECVETGTAKTDKTPDEMHGDVEFEVPASRGKTGPRAEAVSINTGNVIRGPWERQPGDMDAYAAALRKHGPMSYGMAMDVLGWGGTRAGQAEQDLRKAGRIRFNALGRAILVDAGGEPR